MQQVCEYCLYYGDSPIGVPTGGFCHRYPPTIAMVMTKDGPGAAGSAATPVNRSGWCGEWIQGPIIKVVGVTGEATHSPNGNSKRVTISQNE
jgi:hypothetical protein